MIDLQRHQHWQLLVFLVVVVIALAVVFGRLHSPTQGTPGTSLQASVKATTDISLLTSALDAWQIDCGRYPATAEGLTALTQKPPGLAEWHGPYVKLIPKDPWGTAYRYTSPGSRNTAGFDLTSAGPDRQFDTSDDIENE